MEETKGKSELEALLVDAEESDIDRALKEILEGKLALQRGSSRVLPRPALFALQIRQRILILLLARHAMSLLGLTKGVDSATAESLASEGQFDVKTAREYLSRLKATGLIERTEAGFAIPQWNLLRAIDEVRVNGGGK